MLEGASVDGTEPSLAEFTAALPHRTVIESISGIFQLLIVEMEAALNTSSRFG